MALMNSLLISWNFDNLTTSDTFGEFTVSDTRSNYFGKAHGFTASTDIVLKEERLINKKSHAETIEASETIQILEEDDKKVDRFNKPFNVQLMVENSMYQIISDEMLNMFSTIQSYAFKFIEPYNKYRHEYNKLAAVRHDFFSKIVEKPNLERYIEFYKWLDSSLGYMINQLIPESANNSSGLKVTVESHILERNKYKHELPLTIALNRNFTSGVEVINSKTLLGSNNHINHTASVDEIYNIENIKNHNFNKNYEIIQSAGRKINNRGEKENKSIFRTVFSSVDGNSEIYKDDSGEYSVFNDLNQKSLLERTKFNQSESLATPYATFNVLNGNTYGNQGQLTTTNFRDNNFISRNIPYTGSNYRLESYYTNKETNINYFNIPNKLIEFFHYTNILLDENNDLYKTSKDIVEPPIEFNIPVKHDLLLNNAFESIRVYYPYTNLVDTFSIRNLRKNNFYIYRITDNLRYISNKNTFYKILENASGTYTPIYLEKLDIIFPRTDLIGLARIRARSRYDEEQGWFQQNFTGTLATVNPDDYLFGGFIEPWSNNSYNNNSSRTRMYWRDDEKDRRRTRGIDPQNTELIFYGSVLTGSVNCLNYPNRKESLKKYDRSYGIKADYNGNPYNSLYAMDCNVSYSFGIHQGTSPSDLGYSYISCSLEQYGDISPYSHFYTAKLLLTGTLENEIYNQPKPLFVHNIYVEPGLEQIPPVPGALFLLNYSPYSLPPDPDAPLIPPEPVIPSPDPNNYSLQTLVINKSYQDGLDCRIRPWYDSYEDFAQNIRHKTQTMSIVPEFIVGNFPRLIENKFDYAILYSASFEGRWSGQPVWPRRGTEVPKYLTINGHERYDQITQTDFYTDLKNFIDPDSNKLKINLKAIKKLLPYNGFYPQQRTAQIAGIFSQKYLEDTDAVTAFSKFITKESGQYFNNGRTLALMQPLFMPGILFNTIKSGIAVSWPTTPVYTASLAYKIGTSGWHAVYASGSYSQEDCYVRRLTYKLPFETILSPYDNYLKMNSYVINNYGLWSNQEYFEPDLKENYTYYGKSLPKEVVLPYLEPTHYSTNLNYAEEDRYLVGASLSFSLSKINSEKSLYVSAINNFLNETVNFFIKDKELTTFKSAPVSEFGEVIEGQAYTMDIVIQKNSNFSMFNRYRTSEGNYIPSASLFGPPVRNLLNVDNEGYINITSSNAYQPYTPPYFRENDRDRITLVYTASYTGKADINDIRASTKIIWEDEGSTSFSEAYTKRMLLKDCLRTDVISLIDGYRYDPNTGFKITDYNQLFDDKNKQWCIKTKFETPLLNFTKCSDVYSGSLGQWQLSYAIAVSRD